MKTKQLKLKPSARDKRRYFVVDAGNVKVEKALLDSIGALGFARAAYMFVKKKDGKTIGSCLRGSLGDERAGLALGGIKIEKVSGTLRGLAC